MTDDMQKNEFQPEGQNLDGQESDGVQNIPLPDAGSLFASNPEEKTTAEEAIEDQQPEATDQQTQENHDFSNQTSSFENNSSPAGGVPPVITQPYQGYSSYQSPYQQSGMPYQQYGYQQASYQPYGQYSGYQPYGTQQQTPPPPPPVENSPYAADQPEPPTPGEPKKKKTGLWIFIVILALAIVASIVGIAIAVNGGNHDTPIGTETSEQGETPSLDIKDPVTSGGLTDETGNLTVAGVAEKLKPSNVGIVIYTNSNQVAGEGSGIIMTADGYIITCAHVISDATNYRIKVFLENSEEYDAKIVGFDERSDVGVIKVDGVTDFVPAEFGDSDSLKVGEEVIAIGNPGGMSFFGSVTNGIVSAIDRPVSSQIGYSMKCIQHNAAINPGNSGGMLCNMQGQVIGINSSKIASSDYEGMGFSIPISSAKDIIDSLIQNGYVKDRAKLGITYVAASSDYYYSMVVKLYGLPEGTVVVNSISNDSDLANYDVKADDMIVGVNGTKLTEAGQMVDIINGMKPGDEITLNMVRIDNQTQQKQEFDITCKLVEDTGTDTSTQQQQGGVPNGDGGYNSPFGNPFN